MGKDKKMERAEEELKKLQKELRVQLDQVMKSLFGVSPRVLVNMLNSLFKEDYDPEQTGVVLTNNEFVQGYEDYDVLRGDVFFRLQDQQERPHQYHIDFQATYDDNMVIRMFEYGLSKAREVAGLEKAGDSGEATIYMPRQLVIYVEAHRDIKDQLRLRIVFPGGGRSPLHRPGNEILGVWNPRVVGAKTLPPVAPAGIQASPQA